MTDHCLPDSIGGLRFRAKYNHNGSIPLAVFSVIDGVYVHCALGSKQGDRGVVVFWSVEGLVTIVLDRFHEIGGRDPLR